MSSKEFSPRPGIKPIGKDTAEDYTQEISSEGNMPQALPEDQPTEERHPLWFLKKADPRYLPDHLKQHVETHKPFENPPVEVDQRRPFLKVNKK